MTNPYHDETGRFCSKNAMEARVLELASGVKVEEFLQLKKEYLTIEAEVLSKKWPNLNLVPRHFDFPEKVRDAFVLSDCGQLAEAIHDLTGYPLVTASGDSEGDWYHAAVRLPSGHILDIEGLHDEGDWLNRWEPSNDTSDELFAADWEDAGFMEKYPQNCPDYPATEWAVKVLEQITR